MWLIWIVDLKGTFIVGEWIKKISLFRIVCHTGIIASAPSYLLPPLFSKKKKKSPSSTTEATTQQEENNLKKTYKQGESIGGVKEQWKRKERTLNLWVCVK